MSTAADLLVGMWSRDARYGPSSQSDEVLVFKSDATGRTEVHNFVLCTVLTFFWRVQQPGVLQIQWEREFQVTENLKSVDQAESDRGTQSFQFSIAEEHTPSGKTMQVLDVQGFFWPYGPEKFGLVRKDVAGYETFDFHLEEA